MNNGYLYCLYSEDGQQDWRVPRNWKARDYFDKELIPSFNSLKLAVPAASVSLYTNVNFDNGAGFYPGFDHVIYDEDIDKRLIAKAHALLKSPYDKTIFLDTDTIIHRDIINDIFEVLDEFNFAVVYADAFSKGTVYPDFNTGLIGVANNDETKKLINEWIKLFEKTPSSKGKRVNDQWAFREVFMKNKKMFHILPTYFMYRWHLMRQYPSYAVLTHDRGPEDAPADKKQSTLKKHVTKKIIKTYIEKHL